MIFDIEQDCHTPTISRPTINDLNTSSLAQIAQVVASTSQLFNIIDVTRWANEHPEILIDDELKQTQAVLCMPIINAQKNVIGVVQFINKVRIFNGHESASLIRHFSFAALNICVERIIHLAVCCVWCNNGFDRVCLGKWDPVYRH